MLVSRQISENKKKDHTTLLAEDRAKEKPNMWATCGCAGCRGPQGSGGTPKCSSPFVLQRGHQLSDRHKGVEGDPTPDLPEYTLKPVVQGEV